MLPVNGWQQKHGPHAYLTPQPLPPQDPLLSCNQEWFSVWGVTDTEGREKLEEVCSFLCLKNAEHTSCLTIKISQVCD